MAEHSIGKFNRALTNLFYHTNKDEGEDFINTSIKAWTSKLQELQQYNLQSLLALIDVIATSIIHNTPTKSEAHQKCADLVRGVLDRIKTHIYPYLQLTIENQKTYSRQPLGSYL
jgi:hypothetical protein